MKAPFRYYGGKARLAKRITALFPPHTVYVEPFCGSAAVLFAKPRPNKLGFYKEVINDRNEAVLSIFRALRNSPEEFTRRVELMPYSQAEHKRAWEVYNGREEESNDVERAALMMLLFSGSIGGNVGGTQCSTPLPAVASHAGTWDRKRPNVSKWCARLSRVFVQNMDALDCIIKWDSPQTLFYCDPPYVGTNQGHYGGYNEDDLGALLLALDACEGAFVLSGYDNELTSGFASVCGWGRCAWDTSTTASVSGKKKGNKRTEVVWYRQRRTDPDKSVMKYLNRPDVVQTFTGSLSA